MTYVPLPTIACVIGLIVGTGMILGADLARAAETRPCTAEEAAPFQDDSGLPMICEVMTVTAKRIDPRDSETTMAQKAVPHVLVAAADLTEQASAGLEQASWTLIASN